MIPPPPDVRDAQPLGVPRVVSRGFYKLQHALHAFALDPAGLVCADLGASVGGFSQCLLACGAARVYAVDTAWGVLDYGLRRDERVRVLERTNALHAAAPEAVGLVVLDMGWTPQRLALPAAARWLAPGGRIVSLIKPHYEAGVHLLDPEHARQACDRAVRQAEALGFACRGLVPSPIAGSRRKGKAAGKGTGNAEWLALFESSAGAQP